MPKARPSADYTKTCSMCGAAKLAENFHSAPTARDGLQSRCKPCQKALHDAYRKDNPEKMASAHANWAARNRDHLNKRHREWHQKNRDRSADYGAKKLYRLPFGAYATMLDAQGGMCAICGSRPNGKRRFHIDHCHATDAIRGLLCSSCNLLIGHAKESAGLLGAAIDYLNKHSSK